MIQVQGAKEVALNLTRYAATVSDRKERQRVLAAGGRKVAQTAAKPPTPKSKAPHHYYSKRGPIKIVPGNLRRSMRQFQTKQGEVEVGPRVLRRVVGMEEIGRTQKTASGFYAAALYGSASAFRQAVMEPALSKAQTQALQAMRKQYERLHNRLTR